MVSPYPLAFVMSTSRKSEWIDRATVVGAQRGGWQVAGVCVGALLFGVFVVMYSLFRPCNNSLKTFSWTMASPKSTAQCGIMVTTALVVFTLFAQLLIITTFIFVVLRFPCLDSTTTTNANVTNYSFGTCDAFGIKKIPIAWFSKLHMGITFTISYGLISLSMFPVAGPWGDHNSAWHLSATGIYIFLSWYTLSIANILLQHVVQTENERAASEGLPRDNVSADIAEVAVILCPGITVLAGILLLSDTSGAGVNRGAFDKQSGGWGSYAGFYETATMATSFLSSVCTASVLARGRMKIVALVMRNTPKSRYENT